MVNPVSGRGRSLTRAAALREALAGASGVEVVRTARRGEAAAVVSERGGRFERVIAVGGDGTLNEVLTGLLSIDAPAERRPALGFLPAGTANAAILAFGFGTAPHAVARALAVVEPRPVDVGIATHGGSERPFLLWCGAGYDAVVIDALNTGRTGLMGVAGLLRRAPSVTRALRRYPAPEIEIDVDGAPTHAASVILANVGKVAFGGRVTEAADPFDGRLDVVSVPRVGTLGVAALAARMMLRSLETARGAAHRQGARIRLHASAPVPFQLDGEPVGRLPVEVRLEPGAVRLLLT